MGKSIFLCSSILFLLIATACTTPHGFKTRTVKTKADEDLMLNDIRFPPGYQIKTGILDEKYRWPNGVMYYQMDSKFTQSERLVILDGFKEITSKTCIQIKERVNEPNYIFIRAGATNSGCWSYLGCLGGRQDLNLETAKQPNAPHCVWSAIVAHECLHALGIHHEQCRDDRDDYVIINYGNIQSGAQTNFDKVSSTQFGKYNTTYDYNSIMHYKAYDFAKDPSQPTIYHKTEGIYQFGGDYLTESDASKCNRMYNCTFQEK